VLSRRAVNILNRSAGINLPPCFPPPQKSSKNIIFWCAFFIKIFRELKLGKRIIDKIWLTLPIIVVNYNKKLFLGAVLELSLGW